MKGHYETIRLKDTSGNDFFLLSETARDHAFYATKDRIRASLGTGLLTIRRLKGVSPDSYARTADLGVRFVNGFLKLGCHNFNRKNTRLIIEWAKSK